MTFLKRGITLLAASASALFCGLASAQMTSQDIRASATPIYFDGINGSKYLLLDRHDLPNGNPVTSVIIRRTDGSGLLMDIGFDCDAKSYVYLAMHYGPDFDLSETGLATLAQHSRNIATTGLQALPYTPITDDPYDAAVAGLYATVCGS